MIKYKAENPIVIIANGEYPNHHIPLNVLINAKKVTTVVTPLSAHFCFEKKFALNGNPCT